METARIKYTIQLPVCRDEVEIDISDADRADATGFGAWPLPWPKFGLANARA